MIIVFVAVRDGAKKRNKLCTVYAGDKRRWQRAGCRIRGRKSLLQKLWPTLQRCQVWNNASVLARKGCRCHPPLHLKARRDWCLTLVWLIVFSFVSPCFEDEMQTFTVSESFQCTPFLHRHTSVRKSVLWLRFQGPVRFSGATESPHTVLQFLLTVHRSRQSDLWASFQTWGWAASESTERLIAPPPTDTDSS